MGMMRTSSVTFFLTCGLLAIYACSGDRVTRPGEGRVDEVTAKGVSVKKNHSTVERIVFIGKKDACDCTREQIDTSWKALQAALEGGPEIAVKRIQVDVEIEEANRYNAMQPMMALPGIYFLDGKNKIAKLLQGEQRVDEIAEVLQ